MTGNTGLMAEIRNVLALLRDGGGRYPCPEQDLAAEAHRRVGVPKSRVLALMKKDGSLVRKSLKKGEPTVVVFSGDDHLLYGISVEPVKAALAKLTGAGNAKTIAEHMGLRTKGAGSRSSLKVLVDYLKSLVQAGDIFAVDREYWLDDPARYYQDIISALGLLKAARKYPAYPGEIREKLPALRMTKERFRALLDCGVKQGILDAARKGRATGYTLAGEDRRYARKPDLRLKFELLGEIEELRVRILELEAQRPGELVPDRPETSAESPDLARHVLDAIKRVARRENRRTIDLWELRDALPEVPVARLDDVLVSLGEAWRVELKPVQDSTRLSSRQRETLLRLRDGTPIVAVAVAVEE